MKLRIPYLVSIAALLLSSGLEAQTGLQSGPMTGYSEMREVALWLQTNGEADVYITYVLASDPTRIRRTLTHHTYEGDAFTALLIADSVEPGNRYNYQVFVNDEPVAFDYPLTFQTQPLWKWRGDAPDIRFLTGSCAYINETIDDRPGKPYGGDYQIYEAMTSLHPDFMIWLGDNLYFREPDWNSRTGILHRYTHTRSTAEMQPFLASVHQYAIWDDHDYGPNDSDRSFWNKNQTRQAFELFWANPSYGVGDIKGAITAFQWSDCDFFLLDNRTYRSPDKRKSGPKTQLGEEQLQWLLDNLATSTATFKFVAIGGQFLTTSAMFEAYTNGYSAERQEIIDFIQQEGIHNVVFLTGDVHFSELSKLSEEGMPTIWDITSSPLNSGPNTNGIDQPNSLRVEGSVMMQHNFAEITVSGPGGERRLIIQYYDSEGKPLFHYEIAQEH